MVESQTAAAASGAPAKAPGRGLIVLAAIFPMFLDVLDRTIVNVALPDMMGGLGTNSTQVTWVLTAYLVASAVFMPLTGFAMDFFGQRRLMIYSISGFILCSTLCGFTTDIGQMVVLRVLQGFFGAPLVMMSQIILLGNFPKEERGKAMALFGIGLMVAPVLGPTLGGLLTTWSDWRWVFFVNLPFGLIALSLVLTVIKDTETKVHKIDWLGLSLMVMGIGAMQIVLDQGNTLDWFQSNFIVITTLVAVLSLGYFIWRGWHNPNNIINIRLFADRNFGGACFVLLIVVMIFYGLMAVNPILLENFLNYPAETTGLVTAPQAVFTALTMAFAGRTMTRIRPRTLVASGILIASLGGFIMANYNLQISPTWVMIGVSFFGAGVGLVFVPLSTLAYETIARSDHADASGQFSLVRTVAGSIGIAIASTLLSRLTQENWNRLGGNINPYDPEYQTWMQTNGFSVMDYDAAERLGNLLYEQASMIAFVDVYWISAVALLCSLPVLMILQNPKREKPGAKCDRARRHPA